MDCHCVRCGYLWKSRGAVKPAACSKCKVKYWWRPARVAKERHAVSPVGRPALFPQLHSLKVGESLTLQWHTLPGGEMDSQYNGKINPAVMAHAKRYGWNVYTEGRAAGLFVLRVL